MISARRRFRAFRSSAVYMRALVVVLGLAQLAAPAVGHAQAGRWLWYATTSGWHHAYVFRVASGPHVAVYAEQGTVSFHDARVVADAVSWRIYPTDTGIFGSPPGLGTVSVALLPLGGITLGYFNEDDVAPNRPGADASHSNYGNLLYVRTPATMPDATRLADVGEVIAHELQHLIDFRVRVLDHGWSPEDDWLNEGLSVYAQFANHYWTQRDALKVQAAASDPGWQLTNLSSSNTWVGTNARAAYGRAGLFVSYLAARFGSSIARDIINTRQPGIGGVSLVLSRRHASLTSVFGDWSVASLLDESGRYGYGQAGPAELPTPRCFAPPISGDELAYGYRKRLAMAPWTQQYLNVGPGPEGTLAVHVHGATAHMAAAVVLERRQGVEASTVRWLHPDVSGGLVTRVSDFGQFYTSAVVILADASRGNRQRSVQLGIRLNPEGESGAARRATQATGELGAASQRSSGAGH